MIQKKIKAMVVDDQNSMGQMAAAVLGKLGAETTHVNSGAAAVNLAKTTRFDVIFMDIEMPEMDGYETTKQIRAITGGSSGAKIIALSGSIMSTDQVKKCIAGGMNDCLVKPLKEDVLRQRIDAWGLGKK